MTLEGIMADPALALDLLDKIQTDIIIIDGCYSGAGYKIHLSPEWLRCTRYISECATIGEVPSAIGSPWPYHSFTESMVNDITQCANKISSLVTKCIEWRDKVNSARVAAYMARKGLT